MWEAVRSFNIYYLFFICTSVATHQREYTCKDPDDFSAFNFCFILEFMGIPTETEYIK